MRAQVRVSPIGPGCLDEPVAGWQERVPARRRRVGFVVVAASPSVGAAEFAGVVGYDGEDWDESERACDEPPEASCQALRPGAARDRPGHFSARAVPVS